MATKLEAYTDGYLKATRKSTLPTGGKLDYLKYLAKKLYQDIQNEPGIEWNWLYQDITAGTVTAGNDTYELDTDINFISQADGNYVRVVTTDSQYIDFKTVRPQQLYMYRDRNAVAKVADNSIKFSKPFQADTQAIGGTITVPAIIRLDDLVNDTDEVIPELDKWLPAMIAAQYVLTDRQLNYLYDDLLAQANEILSALKLQNEPITASYQTGIDYFASTGNVWGDE